METKEERALMEAFDENADALFRHASFRVGDRERAYDLTQDTFLKAWNYLREGGSVEHYKSFLYRILHNLIIDEYRKKSAVSLDAMLEDEAKAPAVEALLSNDDGRENEERIDERALLEKIRERIPELPEQYRVAITLRFVDDFSIGEIAKTIGVSENVVSVRLHRGIAKLRALCKI